MLRSLFGVVISLICIASQALAHEGVTYPILKDRVLATKPSSSSVSIIADPDLGNGTLTFIFKGEVDLKNLRILTKSSPEVAPSEVLVSEAQYQTGSGNFVAKIPFTSEGRWTVHFQILQNKEIVTEFDLPLDVIPPGPSRKEFLLYSMPFLAIAALALRVLWHRRYKYNNA